MAGETCAATSVGFADLVASGAMATGTLVVDEVVAEETETVAAATWVAVDRDTEPLAVSFSWILETRASTGVPDNPAPQAAKVSRTTAETQPRPGRFFGERIIEVVFIRCCIGNPQGGFSRGWMLEELGPTFDMSRF